MTVDRWNDDLLDGLREEGDLPADRAVAAYFADLAAADPAGLVRRLVDSGTARRIEDADGHIAAFLDRPPDLPDWVDPQLVAAGQERFARWGSHVFTALYAAALPSAYACWRGVEVLGLTARLVTDARRRLNETAQFHLDVMTPGGLAPGRAGFSDIRHVRLMHAAVRRLVLDDRRCDWDAGRGVPINQEDLLETLLTFTEVVFEVFERTGVRFSRQDADCYLHVWSLVGYLLGVRPDLLPLTRDDTTELMATVRRRQFGPSRAGSVLTAALLAQGTALAPPGLKGLPASTVRYYVGDTTADLLGVPPADWTRVVFGPLAALTRLLSVERAHRRFLTGLSDRIGFGMLRLAVQAERAPGRPPFAVPTELADRWGLTVTAARRGRGRLASGRPGPG